MPDFTREEIQRALLYGATPNLAGANLEGVDLSRLMLSGANLDGANLDGANLYGAKLEKANRYRDWETDRKSTRLNSSHLKLSRMPSSA